MANFGGRRAPNVSQYIANLNTIPSEFDVAAQQEENYSLADDLAIFTNAEFFDFDLGAGVNEKSAQYDAAQEARVKRENAAAVENKAKGLDFVNGMFSRDHCLRRNLFDRFSNSANGAERIMLGVDGRFVGCCAMWLCCTACTLC